MGREPWRDSVGEGVHCETFAQEGVGVGESGLVGVSGQLRTEHCIVDAYHKRSLVRERGGSGKVELVEEVSDGAEVGLIEHGLLPVVGKEWEALLLELVPL